MFFHSPTSLFLFLPFVFIFYPFIEIKSFEFSKVFLLFFSLIFYGFNHPWFLIPLIFSASLDFFISKSLITKNLNNKVRLLNLIVSVMVNIGLLTLFKYIPFIEESLSFHYAIKEQFIQGGWQFMGIVLLCLILILTF